MRQNLSNSYLSYQTIQTFKTDLRYLGSVGYCAAKDKKYFGFKGHILVTQQGVTVNYEIAAAHIDERGMIPEIAIGLSGMLLADKGLIRPQLKADLAEQNLDLQTPLRKNMKDSRPKETVALMMNIRRKVETVIGQLTERFQIQCIKAKDMSQDPNWDWSLDKDIDDSLHSENQVDRKVSYEVLHTTPHFF